MPQDYCRTGCTNKTFSLKSKSFNIDLMISDMISTTNSEPESESIINELITSSNLMSYGGSYISVSVLLLGFTITAVAGPYPVVSMYRMLFSYSMLM